MLPTAQRIADFGYRSFSASMMLLSIYGGYLCTVRAYRYMNKQKELQMVAENQDVDAFKS